MGIECRTSNDPEKGPIDITKHWEKFYTENISAKIPNKTSDEVFGLYCDYEGGIMDPYSLVIGHKVDAIDQVPEGMVVKVLPKTSYAVFRAVGSHPDSLIATWGEIWQSSLNRTFSGDFELYGAKFSADPKEVEVYIAIEN